MKPYVWITTYKDKLRKKEENEQEKKYLMPIQS